ncbi:MAG: hypothetical protein AB1710_09235 [Pseudomonadota bacterium]
MIERTFGRKVALGFSVFSFLGAGAAVAVLLVMFSQRGGSDVIVASLLATVVFMASCGVVLYQMSKPPRHVLLPWDHDGAEPAADRD